MIDMYLEANVNARPGASLEGSRASDPSTVPGLRPDLQQYEHYLRGHSLDHDNFEVIDIVPQDKELAVTVQHDRRRDAVKPWCVRYRGSGHYFSTLVELNNYCQGRRFKGWH